MNGYFRIVVKSFIVLCVVFAAGVCRAGDYAPEPPPKYDKGWNLVSVPCDISIGDFKRDMKEDTLKVYGWNGAEYEETESLERGRGYFINVNSVLNPSSVCKPKAAKEDMKVVFKPGWNLIGNPYHKAATFTQLLGDAAEKEDTAIFELKWDKAIPVKPTAQAKPWRGYWLYVTSDVVMPIADAPAGGSDNALPAGSIVASPARGEAPLAVVFKGNCSDSDGTCVNYSWDFGDGSETSGGQNQSHTYTKAGAYKAVLTVEDNDGGRAVSNFQVNVTVNSGHKGLILGGAGEDVAYTAQQTVDGGYFIAGYTMSSGKGQRDYWALKLDASGKQMWSKTYGGSGDDFARTAFQTADGGYIVGGYSNSPGVSKNGAYDIWLVKLDAAGGEAWTRTYGASGDDRCHSMTQTSDGGYAILAYTTSEGAGNFDYEIMKLDASGNLTWKKTYGGARRDDPDSVRQTSDGGYIMTGLTYSYGAGDADVWLVKTDADGKQMWAKTFGGAGFDQGISVWQTGDGGYIVAAYSGSAPTAGGFDAWLIKVDSSGNVMWDKKYGATGTDLAYSVKAEPDGGYIAAGMWNSDLLVMKIDSAGNHVWKKTFGGAGVDFAFETSPALDGGYILAGATGSYLGGYDAWVIRLDKAGNAVW